MAAATSKIPVVDLGQLGSGSGKAEEEEWTRVSKELDEALSSLGCAYLTGHGIPDHLVDDAHLAQQSFFNQDEHTKIQCAGEAIDYAGGYIGFNKERFGGEVTTAPREGVFLTKPEEWSGDSAPTFKLLMDALMATSKTVIAVITRILGKDHDYLTPLYRGLEPDKIFIFFRLNHYPPASPTTPENSVRFGAHRDFGVFALLLSNGVKSLQVRDGAGLWMDVEPRRGTVVLLVGEQLRNYSLNRLNAVEHQVIVPAEEKHRNVSRYSSIYFVNTDLDTPLYPQNHPNAPKITCGEYSKQRFNEATKKN